MAKLKAFITESSDEFRRPYAMKPMVYPRRTSFYATVNNGDFLKDDTGNRRYWVIPVEKIDLLYKYVGKEGVVPKINKMDSLDWNY